MAVYKNFSQKDRKIKSGHFDDFDKAGSNIVRVSEALDYDEWAELLSYYRHYIDIFAEEVLGITLFPFQKLILRAMARYQNTMLICSRGIGKSWISAVFMFCTCILFPSYKFGIVSGKGQQSRNVIIQKIKGELLKNDNLKREINFPVRTGQDECYVQFKNGSEIRAVVLGINQSGDSARSWRFNGILVDEARLVNDSIIEEVLVPMTKTNRENIIHLKKKFPQKKLIEKGKMVYISSAYLKTCDLYSRFLHHYSEMLKRNQDYFVCSLDYEVGVDAGIFEKNDILKERDKPSMTIDKFTYEYEGVFVGSAVGSYFPFELTEKCRQLEFPEIDQPKKSLCQYIITHDVAVSKGTRADNSVTHVIKLKQRTGGTYYKEIVFTKTMNGVSLIQQRDFLRELIHIRFPNTIKLCIDVLGSGAGLPSLFYETWEYDDRMSGNRLEFPPLVRDDDEEGMELLGAIPFIKPISASSQFNASYYPYMKSCFEDRSCKLLKSSNEMDAAHKEGEIDHEEFAQYLETDVLIQELSNIQQAFTDAGITVYERIVKAKKRDRATSLMYGLSYVFELETEKRQNYYKKDDNKLKKYKGYINF